MTSASNIIFALLYAIGCCWFTLPAYAQTESRILFYNVENLFDTQNDSLTQDDEFTPQSSRAWTYQKYRQKLLHIFKVISAAGQTYPPDIIGLCEIENRQVLKDLAYNTPLKQTPYFIVHEESPDHRGIDVALLFRPEHIELLYHQAIPLHFPTDSLKTSRDILYTKLLWHQSDTLHLFVNHWPSRWGGVLPTEPYRCHAATVLRQACDSLLKLNPHAAIIIMGDFNDYPTNKSIADILLQTNKDNTPPLHNLMAPIHAHGQQGTHKHETTWGCLDQLIVSQACLAQDSKQLHIKDGKAHIFAPDFLLMPDDKHLGHKPFRTWLGFKYIGGFSDHLPIYIDIIKE